MAESIFMKVSEVAKELGVSESYAYKLVRKLNKELAETGCIVIVLLNMSEICACSI